MMTHSIMWIRATRAETCAKCRGREHLPTNVQFVAGVRDGARCWRQRWRTQKCGFGQRARQHARDAVEESWRPVTGQSHVSVELHIFARVPFCPLCSLHMLALDMMQSLHKCFDMMFPSEPRCRGPCSLNSLHVLRPWNASLVVHDVFERGVLVHQPVGVELDLLQLGLPAAALWRGRDIQLTLSDRDLLQPI